MFKQAREKSQVVVMYFGNKLRTSEWLAGTDLAELNAAETVVCLRLPKPEDAETPAKAATRVPAPKLSAANLWAAYGVTQEDTFIVVDRFGNEYRRTQKKELADLAKGAAKHFREQRAKLKENLETAAAAREKGNVPDALAALHKAFKLELVGYDEADAAAKLYTELMAEGRKQLAEAAGNTANLEALARVYAGSDLEAEILAMQQKASG